MKKIFALVLTLCLLCGMTAMATEYGPEDNNAQTELKVTVDESYTVVIPATVNIPFEATSTNLPVEVTALRLYSTGRTAGTDRKLYVRISSNDGALDNENGDQISYNIGGSEATGGSIRKILYFTEPAVKNFTIDIDKSVWDTAPAGSYTNTISFTIAIDDI